MQDSDELKHEYGFGLIKEPQTGYDAIILAVSHKEYSNRSENYFYPWQHRMLCSLISKVYTEIKLRIYITGRCKAVGLCCLINFAEEFS
jgi:hypothetical protein